MWLSSYLLIDLTYFLGKEIPVQKQDGFCFFIGYAAERRKTTS